MAAGRHKTFGMCCRQSRPRPVLSVWSDGKLLSVDPGALTFARLQTALHLHDEAFAIYSSMTGFVPTCASQVQAELLKCKDQIVALTRKAPPNLPCNHLTTAS